MKQIFNPRPIFAAFVCLILGIVATTNIILSCSIINIIVLVFACIILIGLGVILVFNMFKQSLSRLRLLVVAFSFIALIIGSVIGTIVITQPIKEYSGEVSISGTVSTIKEYSNAKIYYLENVKINDNSSSGELELIVFNKGKDINIKVGNKVKCVADISTIDKSNKNLYLLANNVIYKATTQISNLTYDNSMNFKYWIKNKIKDNMNKHMNSGNADISYSIIFGEKENMNNDTYKVFSYSGIAHILAVSGLHIGFLVTMLLLLFKVFRFNRHLSNGIIISILIFYASLCNYTPSVTRAVIMSIILILAKTFNRQYDGLNSISMAGLIILLVNPLSIYLVGFQLSFLCVFSIMVFASPITKLLTSIKCPYKLANSMAVSLSVNIGVACVMLQNFKQVSLISVLSNMVILPIFSVCFCTMFLVLFLGLIFPFVNYVLIIPNVLLHFIKLLANFFCNINIVNFEVMHFSYVLVALGIIASYVYHFALVKISIRRWICVVTAIVIIASGFLINIPQKFNYNYVMVNVDSTGDYAFITNKDTRVLIVNDMYNSADIIEDLNEIKVNHIDYIVVNKYSVKQKDMINELISKYKIKVMYVDSRMENIIYNSFSRNIFVRVISDDNNTFTINDINFKIVGGLDENLGVIANYNNTSILILNNNANNSKLKLYLDDNIYDYVITTKGTDFKDLQAKTIINRNNISEFEFKNLLDNVKA